MALWATWGSCFVSKGGCQYTQPLFNTSDDGWQWGRFIGRRFGERSNVVFVLGGDISEPVQPLSRTMVYRGALMFLQRLTCHTTRACQCKRAVHNTRSMKCASGLQHSCRDEWLKCVVHVALRLQLQAWRKELLKELPRGLLARAQATVRVTMTAQTHCGASSS